MCVFLPQQDLQGKQRWSALEFFTPLQMGLIFSQNLRPKYQWLITKPHNLLMAQIFWVRTNFLQLSIIIITFTCSKWLQYKAPNTGVTSCLASPHRQMGFDWRSVMAFHSSSVWDGAPWLVWGALILHQRTVPDALFVFGEPMGLYFQMFYGTDLFGAFSVHKCSTVFMSYRNISVHWNNALFPFFKQNRGSFPSFLWNKYTVLPMFFHLKVVYALQK